jgi:hypothetical protein
VRHIIAPSFREANDAAIRHRWKWPEWKYVGSVEGLRGVRSGSTVYVAGDDHLATVIARLRGTDPPSLGELVAPCLAECQRRSLVIEYLK